MNTQYPVPSFAHAFAKPDDVGPVKSFILYGKTGTRKTTMIAELVAYGLIPRGLIIDIDNGTETLAADPNIKRAIDEGRLQVLPIDPLDPNAFFQLETVLLEVLGVDRAPNPVYAQGELVPNPSKPDLGYGLVALDTMNIAQEIAVQYYLRTVLNEKGQIDTRKAWGLVNTWTMTVARAFQNTTRFVGALPMHVTTDTENTGKITVKPKLSGGAKDNIATIPSLVAHLDFERTGNGDEVALIGYVGESDKYESKNRYRLEPRIAGFNLVSLWQMIDQRRAQQHALQPTIPTA